MKWLVILALLANLLFFIAQNNRSINPTSADISNRSAAERPTPRLRLLTELPEPIVHQLTIGDEAFSNHSIQSDWCEVIGPFTAGQELEEIQMKLVNSGFNSEPLQRSSPVNGQYWAFISAQDDRKSILATLAMLRTNNIDGHLLQQGDGMHTISLKYFADRADATEFIDRIAQLDVLAEVIDLTDENAKLWLKIPYKSDSFLPDWINDGYPDKKTLKDNCDKVAYSAKFH